MNYLKSFFFILAIVFNYQSHAQCPSTISSLGQGNGLQVCWPRNEAPNVLNEITYDGVAYSGNFVNSGQGDCWRTTQAATTGINGNHTLEFNLSGTLVSCNALDGTFSPDNLPISLAYFGAHESENAILIEWQTLEEENNAYFEVERSMDGIEFEIIYRQEGAGTTADMQFYEFEDQEAIYQNASYYYRLKQVDFDGNSTYSEVVVVEIQKAKSFEITQVFPNPAEDQLNILLNIESSQNTEILVLDATGRVVLQKILDQGLKGIQNVQLNLSELQAGCYFLRIQSKNTADTNKFIKI